MHKSRMRAISAGAPTCSWMGALLNRRVALVLILVYLIVSSINELTPVASRAIRWASAWHKPALSAVMMACLAWTWRGQAQRLWASISALVHRHILHSRPATYGDLCRDRGALEATWGLP